MIAISKIKTSSVFCGLLAAASALGACVDGVDDVSSETAEQAALEQTSSGGIAESTLIARVETEGASLSLYEPEPGTVVEVERGQAGAKPMSGSDLSFSQRYQLVSGKAAPAALRDAEKRAGAEAVGTSALVYSPVYPPDEGHVAGEAPNEDWFISQYCEKQDRFLGGLNRTGDDLFIQVDKLAYWKAGVYVKSGSIVYRYSYSGRKGDDHTIGLNKGEYSGYRVKSKIDQAARSWVTFADDKDANGRPLEIYHHCINYHY